MERKLQIPSPWMYILNGLVTLGCMIAFLLIDGKEYVFAFYIPLDLALNMCKTAFFWINWYDDKKQKEDAKRVAARLE